MMKVYLDYAATGPVKKQVLDAMVPYLTSDFGNPSSIHSWGRSARGAVDEVRNQIAKFLNCDAQEIVFTSGGTESDNLAIKGLIESVILSKAKNLKGSFTDVQDDKFSKSHIITSTIEHHAVLKSCEYLEKNGLAEVTYVKPNTDGFIDIADVNKAIKSNTVLVSIMYVNNEIGTVQPIREIGKLIERENRKRLEENGNMYGNKKLETRNSNFQKPISLVHFHSDAVQAAEYQIMDVKHLHVDLLTISGHKIGAPKGIGALYIKKGTPMAPQMHGGEQEFGTRAGTENVPGIVALGKAIELIDRSTVNGERLTKLRDYFIDTILTEIPDTELNGSRDLRSPNNINIYFKYVEGESVLLNLDLVGIAASTGSACASASLSPSHVITATYDDAERAHGSIRFTLGQTTTKKEIDYTIDHLKIIIKKLRMISPLAHTNNKL